MLADFCRFGLPAWRKVIHENHVMRIAHRNGRPAHLTERHLDGKLVADLWFSHSDLELKRGFAARSEHTGLDSRPSSDRDLLLWILRTEIGGNIARAVAGDLRVRAVGVDQPGANIGIL